MDTIANIIKSFLTFLLRLLELFVDFMIAALNLILEFARNVVAMVV